LTAQNFNCTDTRFRSFLDTHSLTQAYDADRAIFPWQQCYSSFPLREYFLLFCLFLSRLSLHPARHW